MVSSPKFFVEGRFSYWRAAHWRLDGNLAIPSIEICFFLLIFQWCPKTTIYYSVDIKPDNRFL